VSDPHRTLVTPPPYHRTVVQAPVTRRTEVLLGGGPGTSQPGNGAVVSVTSSRALTAADSGNVLQCNHGITLSIPAGLPAGFGLRLLVPAAQVWAGGVVGLSLGSGVSLNGSSASTWTATRTVGSTAPWMAWLQRETAANTFSLVLIGAELEEVVVEGNEIWLRTDELWTDTSPIWT
jgi:hypothetical protein